MVDALIEEDLAKAREDAANVLDLVADWLGSKGSSIRKEPSKQRDVDHVLNSSKIEEPKRREGSVSFPVDLFPFFLFDHFLDEEIGEGGLEPRNHETKGKGVGLGDCLDPGPERLSSLSGSKGRHGAGGRRTK